MQILILLKILFSSILIDYNKFTYRKGHKQLHLLNYIIIYVGTCICCIVNYKIEHVLGPFNSYYQSRKYDLDKKKIWNDMY